MSAAAKTRQEREFNVKVGRAIEAARHAAGLRRNDLAARLRVSANLLFSYESGASACPPFRLRQIADGIGVGVQRLIPKN